MLLSKTIMKNIVRFSVMPLALLSLTGCATILGENSRTVCVNSNPQGAGIYMEGERRGTTPANITMPNYIYGGKSITLKKDGYHEQKVQLCTKFQPCGLLNILFWPGFIIDAALGNSVKFDPAQLNVISELQVQGRSEQAQNVPSQETTAPQQNQMENKAG
jgi:hypothetical protein